MIKVTFPHIAQIKFYEQDRDNFVKNRVTALALLYIRPGKRRVCYSVFSRQMLQDMEAIESILKRQKYVVTTKNEAWYHRVTFGKRLRTKLPI